jgi:glyoxylase-like metal-dependent hydrolase (beta-lactamase superfamily II)
MVERTFAGRVVFHDGDEEIEPGLTVHRIGGHTLGLQAVRVETARGQVVLASDASHFYANMEQGRPFPSVADIGEMLDGFRRLRQLASSEDHIVPGHDPLVLARYPAARDGLDAVVRLDLAPKGR